jgi:hypothetical protein
MVKIGFLIFQNRQTCGNADCTYESTTHGIELRRGLPFELMPLQS